MMFELCKCAFVQSENKKVTTVLLFGLSPTATLWNVQRFYWR